MKKIEEEIVATMKRLSYGTIVSPICERPSKRDTVVRYAKHVEYRLYGSVIATYERERLTLALGLKGWDTNTTKSRINAIARAFDLPTVYQEDRIWYWTDGEKYTGARLFSLDK